MVNAMQKKRTLGVISRYVIMARKAWNRGHHNIIMCLTKVMILFASLITLGSILEFYDLSQMPYL